MKIGYLGAGTWGSALANLLSEKGYDITIWDRNLDLIDTLKNREKHPKLQIFLSRKLKYTKSLEEAIEKADIIIESVTSKGVRAVLNDIVKIRKKLCPIVITSKGMEQHTGLLFPEIALEILKKENMDKIGCLSGPSHAEEVVKNLPTLVVASSFDKNLMTLIGKLFTTKNFRVYPNSDILGVSFGGAMKNIIAIACAISDGLNFGDNTRAALITRGLHELKKLAPYKGCKKETLNGLSGLGDLLVTCTSTLSRNYRFGTLLSQGYSKEEAEGKIGMIVEGVYTCVSAVEFGKKNNISLPISEATYRVLYENLPVADAVDFLLNRVIKEEHL
ncbi:MAG: glycerol-3-phosphate dehydrogenase [Chlamydiae bacterium SM23_39]|nr:MAG: glycerol-3-phosphate dehydrogenase [Chlamydiae bacterium SM23_39]